MRESKARTILAQGGAIVNGWCAIPSSVSAETLAHQGFDSITIDLQHGLVDYQVALTMLQAISQTDVTPMCRVPWLENGIIMKLLDAGAYGLICPMVNTQADAQAFVAACSYAPEGVRLDLRPETRFPNLQNRRRTKSYIISLRIIVKPRVRSVRCFISLDEGIATPS